MGKAILTKVVPQFYDREKHTLYFAAIKSFVSSDFVYLKPVSDHSGISKIITHKIDFNTIDRNNTSLEKLVNKLKEHSEKGWIKYGVPLDVQDSDSDKLKYLSSKFFNDFAVEAKKAINKNFDEPNLLSRNDIVHFDVGHGLSCFDMGSRLLFDCGSKTIGYSTYVDSIRSYLNAAGVNSQFSIVISHDHIDHHSFLIDLYNEFDDRIEFVYLSHIFNYLSLPSGLVDKFRRIDWGAYVSHGDVLIGAPNLVSFNHNLNSLIAVSNRDLLTGDQSYARIKEIIATMSISASSIGSIALPHHGRGTSGLPSTLGLDPGVNISFSDNKTTPSATEKRYYTTLPTKV